MITLIPSTVKEMIGRWITADDGSETLKIIDARGDTDHIWITVEDDFGPLELRAKLYPESIEVQSYDNGDHWEPFHWESAL